MAVGDLVTEDWGFEYRGQAFGGTSDYLIAPGVEGLWDNPDVATADQRRLRRHGLHPGDDFMGAREVTIPIEITGVDTTTWTARLDALKTAMAVDPDRTGNAANGIEDALVFQVPGVAGGGKRLIYARPRGLAAPIDQSWFYQIPVVTARFVATSPFIYDATATTLTSPILVGTSSGATWPFTWPLSWGALSPTSFAATNSGTRRAEWTATITGPVDNPQLVHLDQTRTISVIGSLPTSSDTLVIDSETRTLVYNGGTNWYPNLATGSAWFQLTPGTNTLSFRASAGTGSLSLTYRNTWA